MQKIFFGLILGLVLIASGSARATEPCEGFGNVVVVERSEDITGALRTYTNPMYRSPSGNSILLCFTLAPSVTWTSLTPFTSPLSLNNISGLPVIISWLNIRGGEILGTNPLLHLRGTSPVTLLHSSLSSCKNCLKISGNNNRVQSTNIQCLNRDLGTGLLLLGRNHEIGDGLNVSDCQTGVQIGSAPIEGNDITIYDSVLNGNGTAIKLVRGHRNFLQANSIYNNDRNNDSIFAGDEGILILNGSNGGLAAPEVQPIGESDLSGVRGGLSYSASDFNCQSPPGQWTLTATFKLRVLDPNGSAEIFLTSPYEASEAVNPAWQQGRTFFETAVCTAQAVEGNPPVANCSFEMNGASKNKQAVILFHNANRGTSTFSSPLILNDPCWRGVISAADLGAPGAGGGGPATGGANIEYAAGIGSGSGGAGSEPPAPQNNTESAKKDDSNNMSGSAGGEPTAAVAGAVTSGGFGGSGASAGCGASLNPAQKFPQGTWYYMAIFSPLAVLVGWRIRKGSPKFIR